MCYNTKNFAPTTHTTDRPPAGLRRKGPKWNLNLLLQKIYEVTFDFANGREACMEVNMTVASVQPSKTLVMISDLVTIEGKLESTKFRDRDLITKKINH